MIRSRVFWLIVLHCTMGLGALAFGGFINTPLAIVPPKGAVAFTDSSGTNTVLWVYPGLRDTMYGLGSGTRLKAGMVSHEDGAHRLACRFFLSPERQWVESARIWVEMGLDWDETDWWANAAIRVFLCADSAGFPGESIYGPIECRPVEAGVLTSGDVIQIDIDQPTGSCPPGTLWVVIEWPPDFPDLVWIGIDDGEPGFNAMYRVGGQQEPQWKTWKDHNPMVWLNTLRYSHSCGPAPWPQAEWFFESSLPEGYIIEKTISGPGGVDGEEAAWATVPGEQTCLHDTMVFADYTYSYAIRSWAGPDTSAPTNVLLTVDSPFDCDWEVPTPVVLGFKEAIRLPFRFENQDQAPLTVRFVGGWVRPESPDRQSGYAVAALDSIGLQAIPESASVAPDHVEIFELCRADTTGPQLPPGTYVLAAHFAVCDTTGCRIRYRFVGSLEVAEQVGIIEDDDSRGERGSFDLLVFPNPSRGEALIEFRPLFSTESGVLSCQGSTAGSGTDYTISIYNVLGREVVRLNPVLPMGRDEPLRVYFDGKDKNGNPLPSALYFIRVTGGGYRICRKLIVLH